VSALTRLFGAEGDRVIGIDVSGDCLWVVALALQPVLMVADTHLLDPRDDDAIVHACRSAKTIAIDAPAALSTGPHAGDDLPPKFQSARCGEVALRRRGFAVPWTTPTALQAAPSWMRSGFHLWELLQANGSPAVLEVFPHAVFRVWAKDKLAKKQTRVGLEQRHHLLGDHLTMPPGAAMWSHDGLDAMAAAVVAAHHAARIAERVACPSGPPHDGSAIWLPSALHLPMVTEVGQEKRPVGHD
jgi:predicted nuclease with RNAse H fold